MGSQSSAKSSVKLIWFFWEASCPSAKWRCLSSLPLVPHPVGDVTHDKSTAGAAPWSRTAARWPRNLVAQGRQGEVSADAAGGIPRCGITRRGGNNDRLSTLWREVISLAGVARSFSSGGLK